MNTLSNILSIVHNVSVSNFILCALVLGLQLEWYCLLLFFIIFLEKDITMVTHRQT